MYLAAFVATSLVFIISIVICNRSGCKYSMSSPDGSNTPESTGTISENDLGNLDAIVIKKEEPQEDDAMQAQPHEANAGVDEEDPHESLIDDTPLSYVDSKGDLKLRLRVDDKEQVFVVSSARMENVGRFWRRLIHELPPASDGNMREMSMLMDNGNAILILVNIAHGRFRQISSVQAVRSIHDLAIICERYECTGLVMPYVAAWINVAFPRTSEVDVLKWIRTSYAFGCELIFGACLKHVALNSHLRGREGNREPSLNGEAIYGYLPTYLQTATLENIQSCRLTLLDRISQECASASKFSNWKDYGPCRAEVSSEWSFGSFTRQMQALEEEFGVSISEMKESTMSVTELAINLLALDSNPFPANKSPNGRFDEFKYRIGRYLCDESLDKLASTHKTHFRQADFTDYNHVLGSRLVTVEMKPLDFEEEDVEEMDDIFRFGLEPAEHAEEYDTSDAAAVKAELFGGFPVYEDGENDLMDVDIADKTFDEEEDSELEYTDDDEREEESEE